MDQSFPTSAASKEAFERGLADGRAGGGDTAVAAVKSFTNGWLMHSYCVGLTAGVQFLWQDEAWARLLRGQNDAAATG